MRWIRRETIASVVAVNILIATSMGCFAERVTSLMVDDGFAYEDTFHQLVRVNRSDVSWPWYSHGITVSNERTQHWVAHWRLVDSPPFLIRGHVKKGSWVDGERLGETLLADGTIIEYSKSVNEPDLVQSGFIKQAHCVPDDPRRVIYDRARAYFVVFCERGLRLYRVGDPNPVSSVENNALMEYLRNDPWARYHRLSLSRNTRYLAVWRHDDLPNYLKGKDPARFHDVLVVDTRTGKATRVSHEFARSARILDAEVDESGTVRTMLCSWEGVAGWRVAVSSGEIVQPITTPERVTGCSSSDRVVWLPSHDLVLFVWHPNLDGHVTIEVKRYTSGESARTEWYLR